MILKHFRILLRLISVIACVAPTIKGEGPEMSTVECEYILEISWDEWTRMGDLKCCFMQNDVEINTKNSKISNVDPTVTALDFSHSKKIFFLPIDVNESFVSLKALAALECQISEISDMNFRGLHKLKFLDLTENIIETIPSHTFDDLISLEYLALSDNRIRTVNGKNVFEHLKNLRKVLMLNNPCIDEVFIGTCSVEQIPAIVERKCGDSKGGNLISCSRILNSTWSDWVDMDERRDCELDEGVRIDSRDFHFTEQDDSVTGLVFSFNLHIFYLPEKVHENFENLQAYVALRCSIEDIFKENFQRLTNLIILDLKGNKIQSISNSVFGDLDNLRVLRLSQNKIKFLNGETIASLKSLQRLHLEENDCIDKIFMDDSFDEFSEIINENCGFVKRSEPQQTPKFEDSKLQSEELNMKNISEQIFELKKSIDEIKEMMITRLKDDNKVDN